MLSVLSPCSNATNSIIPNGSGNFGRMKRWNLYRKRRAAGLGKINCKVAMYWDVKTVKPLPDFCIYVEIEDGRKGIFDLKSYLDHGVFRELRNVHYFNQVGILFGAVTWPNEQDIAPETLLTEMVPMELIASH